MNDGGPFQARQWADPDGWHIDVRGLPPPQPLVAILRLIDATPTLRVLIVHHDRDPMLLYPELAERGWAAERIEGAPGEVRLRLQPASMA
ncbi:MAG TPA: DUF2249 domain-containing protein [Burkholderiaceae bacterium]|nr:DUF2249 domain-containing protein [Burkholderiaceae bacterium]HSB99791.1 DUF2249 domain-containing protein [Burkholderiaceae bacterium]